MREKKKREKANEENESWKWIQAMQQVTGDKYQDEPYVISGLLL